MRSHSFLKWFFIALLQPLPAHAVGAPPQNLPAVRYLEPDLPAPAIMLPAARPDVFAPTRSEPSRASLTVLYPDWKEGEVTFEDRSGPVSANLLRAPGKARRELNRGLDAARRKDWARATQHLQNSLDIYPEFSAARYNLGAIALLQGDTATGEKHIERALELDDRNMYALFMLTEIRLAQRDTAAAQAYVERMLVVSPGDPFGLWLLAGVQTRQGRTDEALLTFARLDRREHRSLSHFHLQAGSMYEAKGELERAVAEYKQYLRETPQAGNRAEVAAAIAKLQTHMAAK